MLQTFDLVEGEVFQEKKRPVKSYDWPRRQAWELARYKVLRQRSPIPPAKMGETDTKTPPPGCTSMEIIQKVGNLRF